MANVSFDVFKSLDIRVAEIKAAEDIPGAERLYKLVVDIGGEESELIAGIKQYYEKDKLTGKKIIVLTNLLPKTIKGVTSHGMLLAAVTEGMADVVLLTVDKDVPAGTKIS
ncbi:MAG: hypothetical protein NT030_00735 [Candidatus Saganbacteria bacterium]|nr:hypothetical protein [Candidatus Saganbacteria bacterium]